MRTIMKICVIGLGYIGLPTAAMFASHGHQVVGVDKNKKITDALNKGNIIIEEDHLAELVSQVTANGSLRGQEKPEPADAFIIAVPTPISSDKKADMRFVLAATEEITPYLQPGNLVILESTSPPGTVDQLMLPVLESRGLKAGSDFYLGHSPERVIPGRILYELVNNSRIAGGINRLSAQKIADLYRSFVEGEIYLTDSRTAEMCKLAENTFRDINIAYANELAQICESSGINVWELISLCNKHPRVNIHQPGPGVGGHCIAVDPWFIVEKYPETALLIHQARLINDSMPSVVADKAACLLKGIPQAKIAVLGVTYKPNVGDMRESPILKLIPMLEASGYQVISADPYAEGCVKDPYEAAAGCDLLIMAVNHDSYSGLDLTRLAKSMRHPYLLDTRNFYDREAARAAGFEYHLLGSC